MNAAAFPDLTPVAPGGDHRPATPTGDPVAAAEELQPLVEAYGDWIEQTGREPRRPEADYLLEALGLGVLWRARAQAEPPSRGRPSRTAGASPTLAGLDRLLAWLVASGEHDEEVERLEGWEEFLRADPASADETLEEIVTFAAAFEGRAG